ncbi:MAG TPA: ABC transporter permease [Actinomycetota bacterium]
MSAARINAVVRRHFYVTIHSPTRLIELGFWPIVDLVLWGMITTFLRRSGTDLPLPVSVFLGGILLWDLVFRAKNSVALCLLEENHSRNLISVLASPVTPGEYLAGAVAFGLGKLAVTWTVMALLAWALFAFGVLTIGPVMALYALVLVVFGVALALVVIGCVLRFGYAADELTWALAAVVVPFSAVFYPVSALPGWAQAVATLVPPAHVFEAMRGVLAGREAAWGSLWVAAALDVVYLAAGFGFARRMFGTLLRRGFVTRYM